jgi:hypothetical protein
MGTKDDGWKDYADPTPLVVTFDARKGAQSIKQLEVKEVQYRKTVIEQMGMAKVEHVIEIRHGKKAARFVYSHGMVALDSPQAKRIKHLSTTEKTDAMHRSLNDPASEPQFDQLLAMPSQDFKNFVATVNAGNFTIVK